MHGEPVSLSWPEYCLTSQCSSSLLEELKQFSSLDHMWVEWRVDIHGPQIPETITPEKVLWTWRVQTQQEACEELNSDPILLRTEALLHALQKYGLVDLQLDCDGPLARSLRKEHLLRVQMSYHGKAESIESLHKLVMNLRSFRHVKYWKIALDFSEKPLELYFEHLHYLELLPSDMKTKLIFVPMGERFSSLRFLSAARLAPFLFCCPRFKHQSLSTALGQPDFEEAQTHLKKVAPKIYYGLLGNPIKQSISHLSHNKFLQKLGIPGSYLKLSVEEKELSLILKKLHKLHFKGLSITIPYKTDVLSLAVAVSDHAKQAGAANTLSWCEQGWVADNTDMKAFEDFFGGVASKSNEPARVLILGAGGTAKAALAAAIGFNFEITLVNRTKEHARELANEFNTRLIDYDELALELKKGIDLFVQTTSLGMNTGDPALLKYPFDLDALVKSCMLIEVVNGAQACSYHAKEFLDTPLSKRSKERGLKVIDGRDFFFRQAAHQFANWLQSDVEELYKQMALR